MSIAESEIPVTYLDYDKALEVAYASKNERCLAVASRLVDELLVPYVEVPESRTLVGDAAVAEGLMEIHKTYPEVFVPIVKLDEEMTQKTALNAMSDAMAHGGLPLIEAHWGKYRRSIEDLEEAAAVREEVAEALFDTPPSEDFLKDFRLKSHRYSRDYKTLVGAVVGLLGSVNYYNGRADGQKRVADRDLERYETREEESSTKLQFVIYQLENTWLMIGTELKDKSFENEVKAAFNDESTTLEKLKQLWQRGQSILVEGNLKKAVEHQRTFDLIISGEAATYVSPTEK